MHVEHHLLKDALCLLEKLIATPSFSREEDAAAAVWLQWLTEHGAQGVTRLNNNVYVLAPNFCPDRPILMLNSHLDTVRPSSSYARNPFMPQIADGRLYGLGSNDAGGSCVALACTFLQLMRRTDLPVNLLLAISAAEEVSGPLGMRSLLPHLRAKGTYPHMAIVGEPTGLQPAIAERGLLVFDAVARGKAGHAARGEGINAIYRAMEDINTLRNFKFPSSSKALGPIGVNITMIQAGTQHNAVPDECSYVVDVRTTDAYTNEQTVDILRQAVKWSELTPRSTHIRASVIDSFHPLVKASVALGGEPFVSPSTSDMALMSDVPSLKIGPGQSSRSHSANEFILVEEVNEALHYYPALIASLQPYIL